MADLLLEGSGVGFASHSPKDLAAAVHLELVRRVPSPPPLETLVELFECMFFASLKTEESRSVLFHIVYLDAERPDPKPPRTMTHDRWSYVRLTPPIPLSSANLVKIAPASDPRTSSFAVYHGIGGRLSIWGLVDQGNRYHEYVNFDSDSGPERPGLFQASITGIGHLVAYIGYEKIAELRQGKLVRSAVDVLQVGTVREALEPGIQSLIKSLQAGWPDEFPVEASDEFYTSIAGNWLSTLRRLLLRVQSIRHGGAFLVTSDESQKGLLVKHKLSYSRLRSALQRYSLATTQQAIADQIIADDYMEKDLEDMPVILHVDSVVAGYDIEETRNELTGAIWFISLLTRVDGLVLMNQDLEVQGFGVEITESAEPSNIYAAGDVYGSESLLQPVEYQRYGTRHRSMMRYCAKYPGSVGFVISQDGDVRVMTSVQGRLILWENIQLQLPKFAQRRRTRRRGPIRRRRPARGLTPSP